MSKKEPNYTDDQACVNTLEKAGSELVRLYKDVEDEDMANVMVPVSAEFLANALELLICYAGTYESYMPTTCPRFDFAEEEVVVPPSVSFPLH